MGYNKDMFEVLDVGVNGEFNFFNSAAIDSENGTVRVVGGSAENLGDGLGGGVQYGNTFQLSLRQSTMTLTTARNNKCCVHCKVNSTDTVLADGEDIINGTSELLTSNYTFANSFIDFEATNNIAFATEEKLVFLTESNNTQVLREGSVLDSLGTFDAAAWQYHCCLSSIHSTNGN